jgi:hypothetical protein
MALLCGNREHGPHILHFTSFSSDTARHLHTTHRGTSQRLGGAMDLPGSTEDLAADLAVGACGLAGVTWCIAYGVWDGYRSVVTTSAR